jgi:hypothetical protein
VQCVSGQWRIVLIVEAYLLFLWRVGSVFGFDVFAPLGYYKERVVSWLQRFRDNIHLVLKDEGDCLTLEGGTDISFLNIVSYQHTLLNIPEELRY